MPSRLTVASLVAALLGAACSRPHGPVKIGLAGPFSLARGLSMRHGAQLAVDQINARGGVHGQPLELSVVDDSANDDAAVRAAQQLYDDPAVVAVVGHLSSGTSLAAAPVYGSGSDPVVMVSPSASSPELSGINPYVFRLCPTDLRYGAALARFVRQSLGARRVGIVFVNNDYGRGVRQTFTSEFAKLGGTVVEEDPYLPAIYSVEPYLARMRQSGVDALMLAMDRSDAELTVRQMQAAGLHWPVVGGDALTGIEAAGPLAEGIRFPTAYLADAPGEPNATFLAAYLRAHPGERPDPRGAGAYDAVTLIARAIAARGADRAAIREYLSQVGRRVPALKGVTGTIAFDTLGDVPAKDVVIGAVRGGRVVAERTP